MKSQEVEPKPDSWNEQAERQRRIARTRRVGAFAVAACALAAVIVALVVSRGERTGQGSSAGGELDRAELTIVDADSGTAAAFTAPGGASELDVTLDASMVAYSGLDESRTRQVFVMDADGSNARQLTQGVEDATNPEWSSDGSMIAYEVHPPGTTEIFTVRLSDGVSTKVTREPREAWDPTWSPDDGSIVFSTPGASGHVILARSVDLATGQTRTLVTDASLPALSPDGARIVFDSYSKEPLIRLSLANNDGSERQVIARGYNDGFAKWSPDSRKIAFIDETDANGLGTYVYDLASGETHFVTAGTIESWFDDSSILVSAPS